MFYISSFCLLLTEIFIYFCVVCYKVARVYGENFSIVCPSICHKTEFLSIFVSSATKWREYMGKFSPSSVGLSVHLSQNLSSLHLKVISFKLDRNYQYIIMLAMLTITCIFQFNGFCQNYVPVMNFILKFSLDYCYYTTYPI